MKPCRKFMKQFAGGRVMFLHVRRGDNVGDQFYPMPRVDYKRYWISISLLRNA